MRDEDVKKVISVATNPDLTIKDHHLNRYRNIRSGFRLVQGVSEISGKDEWVFVVSYLKKNYATDINFLLPDDAGLALYERLKTYTTRGKASTRDTFMLKVPNCAGRVFTHKNCFTGGIPIVINDKKQKYGTITDVEFKFKLEKPLTIHIGEAPLMMLMRVTFNKVTYCGVITEVYEEINNEETQKTPKIDDEPAGKKMKNTKKKSESDNKEVK